MGNVVPEPRNIKQQSSFFEVAKLGGQRTLEGGARFAARLIGHEIGMSLDQACAAGHHFGVLSLLGKEGQGLGQRGWREELEPGRLFSPDRMALPACSGTLQRPDGAAPGSER